MRARFGTRKGVGVQAGLAVAVCLATLLGISPDADGAAPGQVVGAVSTAILVMIVYVAAATSSGEIAFPGEKPLVDLAMSPFGAGEIARGKALASAVFAVHLALAVWPAFFFLHALRDGGASVAAAQAGIVAAVAWGFAGIGIWLSGAIEGDLMRSLALWGLLLGVFGLLPLLGGPAFQPVRAVHPDAPAASQALCVLSWLVIGTLGFWGSARRVPSLRGDG
jgi:hypothetical protein